MLRWPDYFADPPSDTTSGDANTHGEGVQDAASKTVPMPDLGDAATAPIARRLRIRHRLDVDAQHRSFPLGSKHDDVVKVDKDRAGAHRS